MNAHFLQPDGGATLPVGAGVTYLVNIFRPPSEEERRAGGFDRELTITEGDLFKTEPTEYFFSLPLDQADKLATTSEKHYKVVVESHRPVATAGARLTCIVNHCDGCYLPDALVLNVERDPKRYPGEMLTLVINRRYLA